MKKMITRRNFLKAAGVSAAALGLAACGGSSSSTASSAASSTAASSTAAKADGKVYYLNFKPEQDQDWQDLAAEYTKETGVPVTVVTAASGLLYLILAALVRGFGANRVMRFFPPVVTGPIIICIGMTLANSAINNCTGSWDIALVAILTVVIFNIWGKGMLRIIPILLGVLVSYVYAAVTGRVDFSGVASAAWIGLPVKMENTVFSLIGNCDVNLLVTAIIAIMPIAFATMIEHIGDICAISSTVGGNFIADPGLHRTLLGDGLATSIASLFGAPANTTYGENTGVLALSKIYDPLVIRIAAVLAIILSFSPKFEAVINTIPTGIIGGISFVLYGMISAIGVRNVVENRVDFTNSRNLIVAAVILVCALGFNSVGGVSFAVAGVTINLSGLAVAAIAGILLNAILPGNDYEFDAADGSEAATSSNLQV